MSTRLASNTLPLMKNVVPAASSEKTIVRRMATEAPLKSSMVAKAVGIATGGTGVPAETTVARVFSGN